MSTYRAVVFVGPTLSAAEARQALAPHDVVVRPPAALGDVLRALALKPRVIVLLDGYFDQVPAVWHKEVLVALHQRVHMIGASSMGALRAVELAPFGMVGIGAVYDAFASGELEDDDEVAVVHGPPDSGYRAMSEALVNIRATLAAATASGVLTDLAARELVAFAKALPFEDRAWPALLGQLAEHERGRLAGWLRDHRVDLKELDARAALAHASEILTTGRPAPRPAFVLERPDLLERLRARTMTGADWFADSRGDDGRDVLDELRLEADRFREAVDAAQGRALLIAAARTNGWHPSADDIEEQAARFRRTHRLHDASEFEAWLAQEGIDLGQFWALMRDEAACALARRALVGDYEADVLDYLRARNRLAPLADRAAAKRRKLQAIGLPNPGIADLPVGEAELVRWYLDRWVSEPSDDLPSWLESHHLDAPGELVRVLVREWLVRERPTGAS